MQAIAGFKMLAQFGMLFHTTFFEPLIDFDHQDYDADSQAEMTVSLLMDGVCRETLAPLAPAAAPPASVFFENSLGLLAPQG